MREYFSCILALKTANGEHRLSVVFRAKLDEKYPHCKVPNNYVRLLKFILEFRYAIFVFVERK